ncbi:Oidioi.mRNA.OKI2018_I69.PAR.g12228.t2.cds [Oikopleura dioica]|uniref:Oidioi.mRNA.OKI2018_I69.PAR.g12228.t2.cds n=1 Tax=Oikopleura dioica TaxID=34765 RepID=A0ABN7RZ41_OIKDI|nr:Oidioi.mRNA.OKI2018_I69.PAR.g12228.t2.cds [Oikopleura dioica]
MEQHSSVYALLDHSEFERDRIENNSFQHNEEDDFLRNLAKSRQQSRGKTVQVNGIWTSQPFCQKVALKPRPPSASSLGFARSKSCADLSTLKPRTEQSSKRQHYSRPVTTTREQANQLSPSPYERLNSPAEYTTNNRGSYNYNTSSNNPMAVNGKTEPSLRSESSTDLNRRHPQK